MIRLTVSFVLRLLDDFTGSASDGGHLFWVDGRAARPQRKPGGYYVFLEPRAPCEVVIESARYSPRTLRVDPRVAGRGRPGAPGAPAAPGDLRFPDCGRFEGTAPPGVTVYAFAPEDPALTFQSEKDGVLTLGSYTAKPLWGLRFSVGQGNAREVFVMEEKLPDGGYRIRPELRRRHRPGEPVERASACLSAADGRFAVCTERGQTVREAQYYDEEAKKWVCLSVAGAQMSLAPSGRAPSALVVPPVNKVLAGAPAANIMDFKPNANVPPFAMCNSVANPATKRPPPVLFTPAPCVPVPAGPWKPGCPKVLIGGMPAVDNTCMLNCAWGGVITVVNPGQTTVMD